MCVDHGFIYFEKKKKIKENYKDPSKFQEETHDELGFHQLMSLLSSSFMYLYGWFYSTNCINNFFFYPFSLNDTRTDNTFKVSKTPKEAILVSIVN